MAKSVVNYFVDLLWWLELSLLVLNVWLLVAVVKEVTGLGLLNSTGVSLQMLSRRFMKGFSCICCDKVIQKMKNLVNNQKKVVHFLFTLNTLNMSVSDFLEGLLTGRDGVEAE